jgi:nickel-dependent lactate racemase
MRTRFDFGRGGLELELPPGPWYEVIESRSARSLPDASAAIGAALDAPIGCAPLLELVRGSKTAAISVCDITRPAPNWLTLPPLLDRLHRAGVPAEGVTILIATGLHRASTAEERRRILGREIAEQYRVVDHDARDPASHRWLGRTRRGTPVAIDERFLAAELHLTLGFIEQHLMLGFSGGRKLVAPGLAAAQTIQAIHAPGFMREPLATEGSIRDNPLHAELLEIARMARHDFLLDVTLTRSREVSGVFAGEPEAAHAAGVAFVEGTTLEPLTGLADAAITSAAGYPLDLTFYQIVKGVTAAAHVVKPGGRILILGECAEGAGSPEFAAMLRGFRGCRELLDALRDAPVTVDQWQLEKLALVGLERELFFHTPGVAAEAMGAWGPRSFQHADDAVRATLKDLPTGARVALIPEGPYVYARVREAG